MKFVTSGYGEPIEYIDNNIIKIVDDNNRELYEIQLQPGDSPTIEITTNLGKLHIIPCCGNVIQLSLQSK